MGKMDDGFYRGVEPVAVISVSNTGALREALQITITRGNPPLPMLRRRDIPPPVLLKHADVKSRSAFERGMLFWNVWCVNCVYTIAGQSKHPDGMWKDDPQQINTLPFGSTADQVIDRMMAILQEAHASNQANE